FSMLWRRRPLRSPLFPYTTLFRSEVAHASYATRPAAIVVVTLPRRRLPSSHEFAERERKRSSRTRQVESRFRRTRFAGAPTTMRDRKSTRLNSSHVKISYAVFCLK